MQRDVLEYSSVAHIEPATAVAIAGGKRGRVDRNAGVIYGVKVIGRTSTNGTGYSRTALAKARPLYEGARVLVNHPADARPNAERGVDELFGTLQNVRESDDGLYADLHYIKSHPMAERVCEAAERFPSSFGLSHNAVASGETWESGRPCYTAIERVRSVDLVLKPATTRGIFESAREDLTQASAAKASAARFDDPKQAARALLGR